MSTQPLVVGARIDAQNPWPGLSAFNEAAQRFFNGREDESAELWRLLGQAPLTVLFSKSGLGKTSLVQAGLFPRLRQQNILPVYVRLDVRDRSTPLLQQAAARMTEALHETLSSIRYVHEDSVNQAAFSSDGTRVVTTSWDRTARVWRADGTGEPVVLKGHESDVRSAAFSPDGTRVVTASADKTARVWRTDGVGEPVVLKGHEGPVVSVAFSPDGTHVVTVSADGTARV